MDDSKQQSSLRVAWYMLVGVCHLLLAGCALPLRLEGVGPAAADVLCLSLTGETGDVALGDVAMNFSTHAARAKAGSPARLIIDGGGRKVRKTVPGGYLLDLEGMELTLRNITLEGAPGNDGALVRVGAGGTLILETGVSMEGNGAGLYVESGTLVMRDGNISGMGSGPGAHIAMNGTFIMDGGAIRDNAAGGVHVDGGSFTMNGGTINGNSRNDNGGGVHVDSGSFTMNGGTVNGNCAGGNGGGVRVVGAFAMHDGIISGNTAAGNGGGVYVDSGGVFAKTGGIIFGLDETNTALRKNNAAKGNAVYVHESATRYQKRDATAETAHNLAFKGVGHADNRGWEEPAKNTKHETRNTR
jgi:hypothetical protein